MQSPVAWQPDGTPQSTHFADIYRSAGTDGQGGWAQARHVFLGGCGLLPTPEQPTPAWAGQPHWHILETGFGLGLNFLAAWHAWRADPQRPQRLHFTSVEGWPVAAPDLLRSAAPFAELRPLAETLAPQWQGLLPGVHRLEFEQGQVVLTLMSGQAQQCLPTLDAPVDSVFLDGFNPAVNPEMWEAPLLKAVARLCRPGTRLATWTVARAVRDHLHTAGFTCHKAEGLPPKRHCLQARYEPHWTPKTSLRPALAAAPQTVLVIGAGLAGSAVAWSLAERGWNVQVLDQHESPAAGASALPAGLVAPHVSPDDAALSRVSRAGVRLTLQRAARLLRAGTDWAPSGVLEHRVEGKHALPTSESWQQHGLAWSQHAPPAALAQAQLPPDTPALWHPMAGWLRPAQLVHAQLNHPRIAWRGNAPVAGLTRDAQGHWQALDAQGQVLATAPQVVLASAYATRHLLHALGLQLPLNALRGQISWGRVADLPEATRTTLPPWPVNGHGSFIHGTPGADGEPIWVAGSTFERGNIQAELKDSDHVANRDKLLRLLPAIGASVAPAFAQAHGWAAVRCTLPDRVPAVGALDPQQHPGLHVCTGMGARGLTLSVLCGEILAAQWHGEPWPCEPKLASALLALRFNR